MRFKAVQVGRVRCSLPLEQDTFYVSDIHAGKRDRSDDFHEDFHEAAFWWFLDEVVRPLRARVVFLGDIVEGWQNSRKELSEHRPGLLELRKRYTWTRGNHDSYLKEPPCYQWPRGQRPVILAEHGHRADVWNWRLGFIGHGVTIAAGILERMGLMWIDDWRWRHTPTPVNSPRRFKPTLYTNYAQRRARQTGAEIVILGHTHDPTLTRVGKIIYANSGCWTRPAFCGSYVKTDREGVELYEIYTTGRTWN